MKCPLYKALARVIEARQISRKRDPDCEWVLKHTERAFALAKQHLPSGSGVDNGTAIDVERSTADKLVLHASYHHMNEHGFYDGWTEHTITMRASLAHDFDLTISGPNRNEIKDYLHELFSTCLRAEVEI